MAVVRRSSLSHVLLDHLVYAIDGSLERGVREFAEKTGVVPSIGGRHPGLGTHNALVALTASPHELMYLELIARDPLQDGVPSAWLGVDSVRGRGSAITTFAVKAVAAGADSTRSTTLKERVAHLRNNCPPDGFDPGEVREYQRQTPDGGLLKWQLAVREPMLGGGTVPFLIEWERERLNHPSLDAPKGISLVSLRAEHPEPEKIRSMLELLGCIRCDGESRIVERVDYGEEPRIVAELDTPNGRVDIG